MTTKRSRDASTGKLVSKADAAARPNETVTEKVDSPSNAQLAKRLALIERALLEDGGRLSDKFRRLISQ